MGYNWYINPLYLCFNLPFHLNFYWKLLSDFFASFTWRNIKDTLGTNSNVFLGHVKAEIFTRLKNEAFRYDSRIDTSSSCNCTSGLFDYTAKRWWPSDQRSPATLPTTDLSFLIVSWLGFLYSGAKDCDDTYNVLESAEGAISNWQCVEKDGNVQLWLN